MVALYHTNTIHNAISIRKRQSRSPSLSAAKHCNLYILRGRFRNVGSQTVSMRPCTFKMRNKINHSNWPTLQLWVCARTTGTLLPIDEQQNIADSLKGRHERLGTSFSRFLSIINEPYQSFCLSGMIPYLMIFDFQPYAGKLPVTFACVSSINNGNAGSAYTITPLSISCIYHRRCGVF